MLDVPFFVNRGHRCGQAALKCCLGSRIPKREFTLKQLETLSYHEKGQITYPIQLAGALSSLAVDYNYFIKPDTLDTLQDPKKIQEAIIKEAGIYAQQQLDKTNTQGLVRLAQDLAGSRNLVVRTERPSLEELKDLIQRGKIPICLLNFDKFVGRENQFAGHYIILTDVSEERILYHNTGPRAAGPNQITSFARFQKVWRLCVFDWDLVVL